MRTVDTGGTCGVNHVVIEADGRVRVLDIQDEGLQSVRDVFVTDENRDADYISKRLCTLSASDVAFAATSESASASTKAFVASLGGDGLELFMCVHEKGELLHASGVYQENRFLVERGCGKVYGPVVLRAQLLGSSRSSPTDDPVQVRASNAFDVAEVFIKAKGRSVDSMFGGWVPATPQNRGPFNVLHQAANGGSYERVKNIVLEGSIDINQGSPEGYTPLILATDGGHSRVVKFLVHHGAVVTTDADDGITALHLSAKNGHADIMSLLLEGGAGIGLSSATRGGYVPLHLAALCGNVESLNLLLGAGASVHDRLADGATALYLASETACVKAVRVLLASNAHPLVKTAAGHTPLDVAA